MRLLKYLLTGSFVIAFAGISNGQNVLDGVYEKHHVKTRKVIPYAPLREADVMWQKRIWRELDLNEKLNLPMTYPNSIFSKILLDAVMAGELTAYDDQKFQEILTPEQVTTITTTKDTEWVMDPVTYEEKPIEVINELDPETDIRIVRIKEDWFFDKQRSVQEPRIIGIAPYFTKKDEAGGELGRFKIFWIYYPELRYIIANEEVFNRANDAARMSYLDLFDKRMFSSYIIKETNVYDRSIQDYATGKDAIIEAGRIKDELILYEHDLWHY